MIGTSVEGPASFPFGAVLFGMTGLGLVGVAIFTAAVHYAIGALLPFVLALLLWKARRPAFSAQFTEKAIETSCPHLVLPYENLQGLAIKLRSQLPNRETPQFFPLQVFHAMGVLEIPSRLNVPSIEIYDFLRHRIPPGHAPEINLTLSDYLQRQEGMFGKDRVWSYGARQRLSRTQTNRQPRAVCLAMFLTGIVWMEWVFRLVCCRRTPGGFRGPVLPVVFAATGTAWRTDQKLASSLLGNMPSGLSHGPG